MSEATFEEPMQFGSSASDLATPAVMFDMVDVILPQVLDTIPNVNSNKRAKYSKMTPIFSAVVVPDSTTQEMIEVVLDVDGTDENVYEPCLMR